MQKKKNVILQRLLNIVTAGTEALVVSGSKFLYVYVKEACRLLAQPRFDIFRQRAVIPASSSGR
jgi:hypothetical protein